jgi:phage terminase large subunit-like protein
VVELLLILLEKERIAQIQYDPYQFASEAQRLADAGFERMVREVNQQTEMVEFANTLDAHIKNGTLLLYPDSEMRSHFSWASAQHTERGWRIIKRRQSRQIDAVVAIAMALSGATADVGYLNHPVFNEEIHSRSLVGLP